MSKIKQLLTAAKAALLKVWAKEPARVVSVVAAVVVFAAAKAGVVISPQAIIPAIGLAIPFLFGGELIRSQVSPAK